MKVHAICISPQRGTLKQPIPTAVFVENSGIQGDGHSGDWGRQVTCLRWESVLESNEKNNLAMGPGDFAENVTIEGLEDFQPGERLRLGADVVLEVSQIGKPDHPSVVTRTFGVSLLPHEGLFCKVITGGEVRPGDPVERCS